MAQNSPTPNHADLVVGWYQQQLAMAQETIANMSAQNQVLTARVVELTQPVKASDQVSKGSDA